MKKTLILLATLVLTACSTTSTIKGDDGTVQEVTDFKASADANARMYEAQADVMWNAQEAVKKCFEKATTDVRVMACAMQAQSANFAQGMSGRPQPNRNPASGTEANADVAKAGIKGATTVGTAAVIGRAVEGVAESIKPAQPNVVNSFNPSTTTTTTTHAPAAAPAAGE